ncbi:hypothetical protein RF11_09735 [Thelohanellus kitauei]|uniref:Tc1-like transposase DDE domain-containing protein n=1 Tax=Thelohanellus kitauei TaxID=669202 RepID=A0A0C2NEP4_THEKT|nr:hypothetical protein RF11_09735 [Thelohanellus kitauei]
MENNINDQPERYFLSFIRRRRVNQIVSNELRVMDNVPFHKTALVQNTIRAFNHVPIYLPPCSPFLNPIENLFSKWKGLVCQANSKTADELYSSIETCSSHITSNDCLGFYRQIERYLPGCIRSCPVENLYIFILNYLNFCVENFLNTGIQQEEISREDLLKNGRASNE